MFSKNSYKYWNCFTQLSALHKKKKPGVNFSDTQNTVPLKHI